MEYEGYLIDLDGTMYRGTEEINGAKEFIKLIQAADAPHLFVTNNSTLRAEAVVKKLMTFGIMTTEEHILTSAIATANYIKSKKEDARCFLVGEDGLKKAFYDVGLTVTDENCDYVVVGLDRQVTYATLAKASLLIREGATFISTNKDAAIPTENGLMPGNGAITAAISVSSNVNPLFIGKPERIIMEEALHIIGLTKDNVLMVGDNYETDILAGIRAEIDTLMVLTGYSTMMDVQGIQEQPTYVEKSLIEWMERIKA